ncbi:MAG TPA: aminotransferase class I/II-fold pyridoxal phosphate-dependent enzyme [Pyrinomonadaceae bacterium]|nr:aminotransferase class I/II-fold pyridoxal phosphate-dependent enzyme [Pyrinomonadaceae bacterium]
MSAAQYERRVRASEYMHWAKTSSRARFNLATSGLANLTLQELQVSLADLELTGESGYGYQPLISLLADRFHVNATSIVTAAGTSFANHLALAALINPGDEVLFESPTYEPLLATAEYLGATVKPFQRRFEEGWRVSAVEVERNLSRRTRLIVITNFHNPSGVLTDNQTLKEVGELARRNNARVLVDEVYLEMLFGEPSLTAFHLGDHFVVTSSLTKAYGLSGLRCGWILAEPELAQRMWRLNDLFAATPVHSGERLSVVALKQLPAIAERAQCRLDKHRLMLNQFLDSRDDLEAIRPAVGSIMFPRVNGQSSEKLCDLLREKYETSVVPGRFFEMPAHFRIGMGGDTESFSEGLDRLGQALDELKL